jgi:hypothetical protein
VTDFENRSIISGIGQSQVGRRLNRTGLDLTIEAALEAVADAGLWALSASQFAAE